MAPTAAYSVPDGDPRISRRDGWRAKEFDRVTAPARHRVTARRAQISDIPLLLRYAEAAIGVSLAPQSTIARIACAHPDALWGFWRHDHLAGGVALLMLNAGGLAALLTDRINLDDPPPAVLANAGERPAAIYVWAILGAAIASAGIAQVIVRLQRPPYELADVFALPATDDGLRFTRGLGFHLVPGHPRPLYRYVRLSNRTQQSEEEVNEYVSAKPADQRRAGG